MSPIIAIAQYQGIGPLSRGIRWFTRSKWSHTAIVIPPEDDLGKFILVEAWGTKGVVMETGWDLIDVLSANHTPGTREDLFRCTVTQDDLDNGLVFLQQQIGKKYGWALLWRFVTRKASRIADRWICSPLGGRFFEICGKRLQRMEIWRMTPDDCGTSMVIDPWLQITTV